jgi:hypothetical protein
MRPGLVNTGTVANATWAATGKYGKALAFNGTSSRVTIADAASLRLTSAMTSRPESTRPPSAAPGET